LFLERKNESVENNEESLKFLEARVEVVLGGSQTSKKGGGSKKGKLKRADQSETNQTQPNIGFMESIPKKIRKPKQREKNKQVHP